MSDNEKSAMPWRLVWEALRASYKYPKAMAFGATILLVGPKGSGKSSVFDYLESNKLNPEGPHNSTAFGEKSGWMPKFVGDQNNYLEVASFVDTKGQDPETAGADAIGMLKPSVIIIVLDGQNCIEENKKYVSEFMSNLLKTDERVRNKIKLIALFINKFDKAHDPVPFFENVKALESQAQTTGGAVFGNKILGVHTVLVEKKEFGVSLVESAFKQIKRALR